MIRVHISHIILYIDGIVKHIEECSFEADQKYGSIKSKYPEDRNGRMVHL